MVDKMTPETIALAKKNLKEFEERSDESFLIRAKYDGGMMTEEALKADDGKYEALYNYHQGLGVYYEIMSQINPLPEGNQLKKYNVFFHKRLLIQALKEDNRGNMALALFNIWFLCEEYLMREFRNPIELISKTCKMGADKYGMDNYRNGFEYSRLVNSLFRHLDEMNTIDWDVVDEESGLPTIAHVGANVMMLLEHIADNLGTNNLKEVKDETNITNS